MIDTVTYETIRVRRGTTSFDIIEVLARAHINCRSVSESLDFRISLIKNSAR